MKKQFYLKGLLSLLLLFVGINASWAQESHTLVFNFEDATSHRTSGTNSYNSNTYKQYGFDIKMTYADAVSSTKVSGNYNATCRVAKNTTNSPDVIIGPIDIAGKTITKISYKQMGVTAISQVLEYSTDNNNWTTGIESFSTTSSTEEKATSALSVTGTNLYIRIKGSVSSSTNSNRDFYVDDITLTYTGDPYVFAAKAPTLTAACNFINSLDVKITNNESGATVYYTTDGTNPTTSTPTSFTETSNTIQISTTTTVKAMAVKEGVENSSVASVTYTKLTPYTSIPDALADATSSAKEIAFCFNNIGVTGKTTKNAYLQDADGNVAIIYNSSGHGFEMGQNLSGTVKCKIQKYYNQLEFTSLTSTTSGISTTDGFVATSSNKDLNNLESEYGKYVQIEGFVYDSTNKTLSNGTVTVSLSTSIYEPSMINGATYTMKGIWNWYTENNNKVFQILPRVESDVVKTAEPTKENPIISASYKSVLVKGNTDIYDVTVNSGGELSVTSSVVDVATATLNGNTITVTPLKAGKTKITISCASTTQYLEGSKEYDLMVYEAANLPFAYDGKGSNISSESCMSENGVGDYNYSPSIKFDDAGDNVVICFNASAKYLAYTIKGNNLDGTYKFDVMESQDGVSYTEVASYNSITSKTTEIKALSSTSRFVKFVYTTKATGNVALGNIKIGDGQSLNVSSVGYATYYTDNAWEVPAGLTVKYVSAANAGVLTWAQYAVGATVPANTGVVVNGAEANYPIIYVSSSETAPTNLLKGSVAAEATTGGDKYYMLSLNAAGDANSVGFYYGATDGAAFTNGAHKAYLALTTAQAGSAKGFPFNDDYEDETTGIDTVSSFKSQVSGKYLENGQIVIVKNGKKYNVNGQALSF